MNIRPKDIPTSIPESLRSVPSFKRILADLLTGAHSVITAMQASANIAGIPLGNDVIPLEEFIAKLHEHAQKAEDAAMLGDDDIPSTSDVAQHASELNARIEACVAILEDEAQTAGRRCKQARELLQGLRPVPTHVHVPPAEDDDQREAERQHTVQLLRTCNLLIGGMTLKQVRDVVGVEQAGAFLSALAAASDE